MDAIEPAGLEGAEERGPERLRFRLADLEAEDLPPPVGGDADRDHDSLRDHAAADAGFAVGRVEEHVRVGLIRERSVAERGDVLVQVRADPRHLGLRDAGIRAERFDEVVDLPGRDAVDVRLHHDREQRLVNPAAPLQQRREERPGAQLRDPQLQLARCGRESAGAGAVALRGAVRGAFERGSTDERGRFRIDQLLVERLGRDPDPVGDIGEFQFPEELEEGRLVKSHRAFVSSCVSSFSRFSPDHRTMARHVNDVTLEPRNYTTPGDVTHRG